MIDFQSRINEARVALGVFVTGDDATRVPACGVTAIDRAIASLMRAQACHNVFGLVDNVDEALQEIASIPELGRETLPTGSALSLCHVIFNGLSLCTFLLPGGWGQGHTWCRFGQHEKEGVLMCELCLSRARTLDGLAK